jgi:peroxiredoxin
LKDARGKTRTLDDWAGKKAVVLVFISADCPLSNECIPDVRKLADAWKDRGVALEAVYPDPDITAESAAAHAKEHKLDIPLLLDPTQELTRQLGARVTPEAVVLTADGKMLYRGRIDDRYTDDGIRPDGPHVRDLEAAVEAVLAGKAPPVAEVKGFGCPIPRVEKP